MCNFHRKGKSNTWAPSVRRQETDCSFKDVTVKRQMWSGTHKLGLCSSLVLALSKVMRPDSSTGVDVIFQTVFFFYLKQRICMFYWLKIIGLHLNETARRCQCHPLLSGSEGNGVKRFRIPFFLSLFFYKDWMLQEHEDHRNLMLLILQGT